MNTEPTQEPVPPKPFDPSLLPTPNSSIKWVIIRACVLLGFLALLLIALKNDVALMRWRYRVMPEGLHGMFKQVLFGFRDFGQILPIVVAIIIILRLDRRRWTIVPAILLAQFFAACGYDAGKLTVGRYRPQPAIERIAAAAPTPVPEDQKADYALSVMTVRETWIGWNFINRKGDTQAFPSGHSAASFAFAGVLAWFYPQLALLFWILAVGCATSRYIDAVHWPSDCIAGACIGLTAAWLSLRPYLWSFPSRWISRKAAS